MTEAVKENNKKLYTPGQVALGSFFGGVLTAAYLLYNNFSYFSDDKKNKYILLIGLAILVCMSSAMLIYGFDVSSVSIGLAAVMFIYVRTDLVNRDVLIEDMGGEKQSWFNVVVTTIVFFLISTFILLANAMLLDALGIINFEVMEQK